MKIIVSKIISNKITSKKLILYFIMLSVTILGSYFVVGAITGDKGIKEEKFQRIIGNPDEMEKISVRSEKKLISVIHQMANTKIVAVDGKINGRREITPELCNELILEVTKSSYDHKEKYIEILERWKRKDFSKCVDDHNFVWNLLNGTVGRAGGLKVN